MEGLQGQARDAAKQYITSKLPWWLSWLLRHPAIGYPVGILFALIVVYVVYRFGRRMYKTVKMILMVVFVLAHVVSMARLIVS